MALLPPWRRFVVAVVTAVPLVLPLEIAKGQSAYSKEVQFKWGTVVLDRSAESLSLEVSLRPQDWLAKDSISSIYLERGVDQGLRFPERTVYLALSSETGLRMQSVIIRNEKEIDANTLHVKTYAQENDSTASEKLTRVDKAKLTNSIRPAMFVAGYEWYRGIRLARITIAPFSVANSKVRMVVRLKGSFAVQNAQRTISQNVPQRRLMPSAISDALVLNPEEIQSAGVQPLAWSDTTGLWFIPGRKYLRLEIPTDGIYRLNYDDLALVIPEIGQTASSSFRLYNYGMEIPVYYSGENAPNMVQGQFLEFVGFRNYGSSYRRVPAATEDYPEYLNRYTDTSTYWLTWGSGTGLRTDTSQSGGSVIDTLTSFIESVHLEANRIFLVIGDDILSSQIPGWQSNKAFAWGFLDLTSPSTVFFNASNPVPNAAVRVFARFASWAAQPVSPAHRLALFINQSDTLATATAAQFEQKLMQASASSNELKEGTNTIRLVSMPTASSVNRIAVDWFDVEYPRQLDASAGALNIQWPSSLVTGAHAVRVANVASKNLVVYRVGASTKRILPYSWTGASPFVATFIDSVAPSDRHIIRLEQFIQKPIIAGVKQFGNLRAQPEGADYVLLTGKEFKTAATQYLNDIQSRENFRTTLVDVQDVFDEYGYGYPTPESIREFFKSTTRWPAPMPTYVCLVGDATYDHKYEIGLSPNTVRPRNVVPSYGWPVSDPWLTALSDSSFLPQMFIGRIPANSVEEFQTYVSHVQSYNSASMDDWNKRYMLFSGGDPTTSGQIESFRQVNQDIADRLLRPAPTGGLATHFYKTTNPQSDYGPYSSAEIRSAIDNGAVLINYIGHSGTQTWDNGIGATLQLMNNRGRFSLITDFGCSTARFAEPNIKCFGELFTLGPSSSAIGYIGNSAYGFTSIAVTLPQMLAEQIGPNANARVGSSHLVAKMNRMLNYGSLGSTLDKVMMLTNTLIGDPVVSLQLPKVPNLSVYGMTLTTIPAAPSDDDANTTVVIPYENLGRVTPDSIRVKISSAYGGSTRD
ncbi:MAG: hypothetical protein HY966_03315, partial [Ignavibacteriales bacterium]|nr:hypothetical protein [Ignavibacteriales bacterium]